MCGLDNVVPLKDEFKSLLDTTKYNLIIHPKSQGSAREWGTDNFMEVIKLINQEKCKIFISGTKEDSDELKGFLAHVKDKVTDITAMMNLEQFISFIHSADGLVANSTGPLHIAAAMGKDAFGIFAPMHPIHPGRWAPLGTKAQVFVKNIECNDCRKNAQLCHCIKEVRPSTVSAAINTAIGKK